MEVFHMRKFASVSVAFILVAGFVTAAPASAAAISNGVACKKLNQSTTVGGRKYKCAKNPLTTSKKLTWLSNDCLVSANGYIKSKNSYVAFLAENAAAISEIDLKITAANASITELQLKLDKSTLRLPEIRAQLAAALLIPVPADPLQAAKLDTAKKDLASAIGLLTAQNRAQTSQINLITSSVRRLQTSKTTTESQPTLLTASIADSKSTAVMICTKGL